MRLSLGPRIARVHVGGGRRAGFSSGLGPVSVYGGGRSRRKYSPARSTSSSYSAGYASSGEDFRSSTDGILSQEDAKKYVALIAEARKQKD